MKRQVDILIGDFNLFSHLEMLKRQPKGLLHSWVLSVEYYKTIKENRSIERIGKLIKEWDNINKSANNKKGTTYTELLFAYFGINIDDTA